MGMEVFEEPKPVAMSNNCGPSLDYCQNTAAMKMAIRSEISTKSFVVLTRSDSGDLICINSTSDHGSMISCGRLKVHNDLELRRVGKAVSSLLTVATEEKRITCGLRPAIKKLEMDPSQILFCVMPHTEDAAHHIQSVLLQAFCYEHNISIIKVDSMEKMKNIIGATDCSCVLVHRHKNFDRLLCLEIELERIINSPELAFVTEPIFKLPAK